MLDPSREGYIQSKGHGSPLAILGSTSCSIPKISIFGNPSFWSGYRPPNWPLVMDQLSHSISSSKVAMVSRALWWASLALARPLQQKCSSSSWGFCSSEVECQSDQVPPLSMMVHPLLPQVVF